MKKKHIKFKSLQELYDHGDTLNQKAVDLFKVSLEESTVDQALIEKLSPETKVLNHRQLLGSEASHILSSSCLSSYSEDFHSLDYLKDFGLSKDLQMVRSATTSQTTVEHLDQDVNDCQGDTSSCISKDDGVDIMSSDHFGAADHKNVTSSAVSVSSFPDVSEKSLNGQSITSGSPADQISSEEGDRNFTRTHTSSSTAVLPTLGTTDDLKSNSINSGAAKPHLQSQTIINGDGSDALVDVRICDICGDVGRDALLALCSKCDEGAEHIYCMTPKMDKVPEDDWLCEECMLMQEQKRQRQAMVERSDNASKPSCLKVPSQGSPTINSGVQHFGKRRTNHLSEAFCLSDKKVGPTIDWRSETKKRALDRRVQSLKHFGTGVKKQLTRVSSLKNLDKGKDVPRQVSSFVNLPAKKVVKQECSSAHRSSKPKQQFCGGSLYNSKAVASSPSDMELQRRQEDIHKRRRSAEENADSELKKDHPDKKGVRYGSGRNSNRKHYSVKNKTNQTGSQFAGSSASKVNSTGTKVAHSSRKNVEDKKGIRVDRNTNVKAVGSRTQEGKSYLKPLVALSVEEKKSPCHSSYMITSPAKNVTAYPDQKVSLSFQKCDFDDIAKDGNDHFIASDHVEVMPTLDLANDDHMVPSSISAVPESTSIWKGTFKLEKSGKLPSDCCGVQAHLSTRASSKIGELVHMFSAELLLKEVPRLHTWPIKFQKNHPTEKDIALYFFAQNLWSYGRSYKMLLEGMINNDLALEANFGGFQLLVFPSSLLPLRSHCWNSLPFLWGVFRVRKVDDSFLPSLSMMTVNEGLCSPATCGSESKFVSAPFTIQNSMQGSEVFDTVVLQSSVPIKCTDQSCELEIPSLEKDTPEKNHVQADTIPFVHHWRKEDSGGGLCGDDIQKEREYLDEDIKSISKTNIIRCDQSVREDTTTIGFCSDAYNKGHTFTGVCDSASEFWHRHDVGSSSFSLDSGPSGSSDGGGCAKSADEEPLENSRCYDFLNLDLCLGKRSESEETVNLDLVLGLPSRSKFRSNDFFKNGISNQDANVSLVLTLGMPWSNS